ncbi:MAG TPA: alpha/beta hydrolase [Leptospiraceae bacterium]|nr:alpha/beta hydrolase [Leptospiraceae bacterium]HMW07803.1 alpha/beta hydrolase [Leptospiraceae bacterium]HMX35043.1 alpha/beta hydrolase [Leptospiraceae bacterium]HMY33428.1 alpha/beta hydrolase [Leptospiraceae bacterium]HMZ64053.1 alpha/beta hydrolase [Leptospiraceae bacterium]
MKHPNTDLTIFGKQILNITGNVTNSILSGVKDALDKSMNWTASTLENLSDEKFLQIEDLPVYLQEASNKLKQSADVTNKGMEIAIDSTENAFGVATHSLDVAEDYMIRTLYENKVISSILGSSHDDLISFSKIRLLFRYNGEDVNAETIVDLYRKSGFKEAILFVPGLFCDEHLWMKMADEDTGLGDYFLNKGYFPIYIRYNQGAHISVNGKDLHELLKKLFAIEPNLPLHVITYSQGGLVLRSTLYYAKEANASYLPNIKKVFIISSPNGGSYIEKIGFWAGIAMQASPFWFLKLAGFIGNLRSDAIKDLSHGIIREEDWKLGNQLFRYRTEHYFGELDDIDAYEIYSFAGENDNLFQTFFGDGIIEKWSIQALTEKVFQKKSNPESRTLKLLGRNHFQILNAPELIPFIEKGLAAS